MTFNLENIRKMMGWCPNMSQNNNSVSYTNSGYSTKDDDTNSSTFSPFFLKNTYVAGSVKEIVIGIILILILAVGAIYLNLEDNSIFSNYVIELMLFFMVLMVFTISRSNVEIKSKYIRVSTMMQWILGSTTYTLDSIKTIKVQKSKFHWFGLGYWGLYIIGTLWLLLLLLDILAGKTAAEFIHILFWIVFCFGYGYIVHITSKSVYCIRISFDPNPSINHLKICTKDAPQIANMIENANRFSGEIGIGGTK